MKEYLFLLVLASVIFAAGCPAGASDCFECGGLACAKTDACSGSYLEGVGNVACACPQDKPCTCYCPYEQYGAMKEQLNPEGPRECPARCTEGCSADMSICLIGTTGNAGMTGLAKINAVQGEVFVRMEDGGWLRATPGSIISDGVTIKTGKGAKASIYLDDGSKIFMDGDTELNMAVVNRPVSATTLDVVVELIKGFLFSDVTNRDGSKFEVDTSVSVTGVKGTKFEVSYDGDTAETKAYEGDVTVTSKYGDSISLGPSEKVSVSDSGFGEKQAFDQSVQDKWWEEQSGAGCCAGFAFLASALGIFLLKRG